MQYDKNLPTSQIISNDKQIETNLVNRRAESCQGGEAVYVNVSCVCLTTN